MTESLSLSSSMKDTSVGSSNEKDATTSPSSLADRMKAKVDKAMTNMEDAAKKTAENMHDFSKKTKDNMKDMKKRTKEGFQKAADKAMTNMTHTTSTTTTTTSEGSEQQQQQSQSSLRDGSNNVQETTQKETNTTDHHTVSSETTPLVAAKNPADRGGGLEGRQVTFVESPARPSGGGRGGGGKPLLIRSLHWIQQKHEAILAALIAIAVCQIVSNYDNLLENQFTTIPAYMVVVWMLIALMIGGGLGRYQAQDEIEEAIATQRAEAAAAAAAAAASQQHHSSVHSEITMDDHLVKMGFGTNIRSLLAEMKVPKAPWTSLRSKKNTTSSSSHSKFRSHGTGLVSMSMTKELFGLVPKEQRKSLRSAGISTTELEAAIEEDETLLVQSSTMGAVGEPERLRAKSLEQDYVKTICTTRGLDVFMADCAEHDLATHPFLIENGLRERPTFILNLMTQWGNVVMYFELPAWVQDWDNLPEESPDDPEDVVALKRFLAGDDEYRQWRLKCLPVLVDGPGPIRYVAPPKKTVTIVRDTLPAVWTKYPAKFDSNGKVVQHCCLEMDGDLVSAGSMRAGASLIKRYLGSIVGDCALLIEKPYLQEEEEPRACLGLCRFDRIDVSGCPDMPPRTDHGRTEEERDMRRASLLTGKPLQ